MTAQRALIYRTLMGNTNHPTAEELHAALLPALPHLSLTTVYKSLNELVGWGEVRRIDAGDGRIRFDPDVRPHAEAVCHRIVDVHDAPPPPAPPPTIAGFQIVRRAETFYGYCPDCRPGLAAPGRRAEPPMAVGLRPPTSEVFWSDE